MPPPKSGHNTLFVRHEQPNRTDQGIGTVSADANRSKMFFNVYG